MSIHLSATAQLRRALTLASGTTSRNGTIVDALNYQALRCIILVGAVDSTGACTYKLTESDDAAMAGATDVADSDRAIVDTDDGLVLLLDHVILSKRYYQLVATKNGLANVQEEALYELYMPKQTSPTNIATEIAMVRTYAANGEYAYS